MARIRVIIADDEKFARERLRRLLVKQPDIDIVAIATNGIEALQQIVDKRPDVLFLDVQMPDLDGFGVLRELDPAERPLTIFVSAFDQYAIKAFDAHGIDYLLKPFSDERFEAALDHTRSFLRTFSKDEFGSTLTHLIDHAEIAEPEYLDRIVIKSGGRLTFLRVSEIDWVEGAGVYVYLHAGKQSELYRATIGQIEKKLNPKEFARVNRSAIVRLDRIQELRLVPPNRDYVIVLKTGTEVPLVKTHRAQLELWLKQPL